MCCSVDVIIKADELVFLCHFTACFTTSSLRSLAISDSAQFERTRSVLNAPRFPAARDSPVRVELCSSVDIRIAFRFRNLRNSSALARYVPNTRARAGTRGAVGAVERKNEGTKERKKQI